MKHATAASLEGLSQLLDQLRKFGDLRERKLGIFYRRSRPFLHFHEDPAGMFADLATATEFKRFPVNSKKEQRAFLGAVDRQLTQDLSQARSEMKSLFRLSC